MAKSSAVASFGEQQNRYLEHQVHIRECTLYYPLKVSLFPN